MEWRKVQEQHVNGQSRSRRGEAENEEFNRSRMTAKVRRGESEQINRCTISGGKRGTRGGGGGGVGGKMHMQNFRAVK